MALDRPSTALARRLGIELRQYRESAGLSTTQAAEALDCTKGKISRMENGRVLVRTPDVAALLRAYGVTDADTHRNLRDLARTAHPRREQRWWDEYSSVLTPAYRDYIATESRAERVDTTQTLLIPGLLQTEEYARAVADTPRANRTRQQLEQFVEVRMIRQHRLTDVDAPLTLQAVLSEAALRQQVAKPAAMARQLRHIERIATERHNVTVQVLPFSSGPHACLLGAFLILTVCESSGIVLAMQESPVGGMSREREEDVLRFQETFADAQTHALSPTDSLALIHRVAQEYRS
ncbi:helix-turn-helix transcriptional regulator [Streptomyces albus]|uniref:helix-turn-helix domain-containing protein n=1 Tax=Streptomyces albus TaxID=1888 RepID=UPI0024AD4EE5|nr:helix-turn-helix transcriptional regulator [Streptomyces albus]MDI6409439.1 helix-turn-helix transcriptional regulator [Streptomyces albus]